MRQGKTSSGNAKMSSRLLGGRGMLQRARGIIRKYPEVFESLAEFDRTRKIPKLYRRKRLNITIDENVLNDFKSYCRRNSINMSRLIEGKMREAMRG